MLIVFYTLIVLYHFNKHVPTVWDIRFSQRWLRRVLSPGIGYHVGRQKFVDISVESTTFIFRVKGQAKQEQTLPCEDFAPMQIFYGFKLRNFLVRWSNDTAVPWHGRLKRHSRRCFWTNPILSSVSSARACRVPFHFFSNCPLFEIRSPFDILSFSNEHL
jgi:hypothetical protein